MQLKKALLIDVDGTVALRNTRNPFDWSRISEDLPNLQVIDIVKRLASTGLELIFITGREQRLHETTSVWLAKHVGTPFTLFCRTDKDLRRDEIIKREIFEKEILGKYEIVAVFDDRNRVVEMWRNQLALTCMQVGNGDF